MAMRLIVGKIRDLILMGSQKALTEHIAKLLGSSRQRATGSGDLAKQLAELDRKIASSADRLLDVDAEMVPAVQVALRKLKERRAALADQAKVSQEVKKGRSAAAIAAQIWELDYVLQNGDLLTIQSELAQVVDRVELEFEQSKIDRRKWHPVRGTVFFFNYVPLIHVLNNEPAVRSAKKATLTRKDFRE